MLFVLESVPEPQYPATDFIFLVLHTYLSHFHLFFSAGSGIHVSVNSTAALGSLFYLPFFAISRADFTSAVAVFVPLQYSLTPSISLCISSCFSSSSSRAPFMASQEPPGIFYLLKITGNFQRFLSGLSSGSLRHILSESFDCSLCLHLQFFNRPRGISHLSLTSGNAVQTWCLSQRELTLPPCLVPLCNVPRSSPH